MRLGRRSGTGFCSPRPSATAAVLRCCHGYGTLATGVRAPRWPRECKETQPLRPARPLACRQVRGGRVCWPLLCPPAMGGRPAAASPAAAGVASGARRCCCRHPVGKGRQARLPHSNCCKRVPNRPLPPHRGRFGTLLELLQWGILGRTAVGQTQHA